jgi:REP element-mobilizing transposase RayT
MPRPLRIEYAGAFYHVMSRGDRREAIYRDEQDRECFLHTLGEACAKTGWQIHAWCLMGNHFHVVMETPQPNLVVGMKWLLGTYTGRFNRRHRWSGHLFGGRYKAQPIDERSGSYLVTACDYVHLNPARARLLAADAPLEGWKWSSYPAYLAPALRTPWLRVDRVLGEHGLERDDAASRREYARQVERVRTEGKPEAEALRSRWWHGAEDFVERLAERMGRRGAAGERARERQETDEQLAARLVREGLAQMGLAEGALENLPKGDHRKVTIARRLREQTPMTRLWIAARLRMGSASYLSALLAAGSVNSKL